MFRHLARRSLSRLNGASVAGAVSSEQAPLLHQLQHQRFKDRPVQRWNGEFFKDHPLYHFNSLKPQKEVEVRDFGSCSLLLLNRPKQLNSLNTEMIQQMHDHLERLEFNPHRPAVFVKGYGGKAFCAGGDIKALYEAAKNKEYHICADFFLREYLLDYYTAFYHRAYCPILNGITMGGGMGISMHAPIRIATEKTMCAMPETGIGFFPDVGASHFLPRLLQSTGLYLGLTGARVSAAEAGFVGIATHFIPEEKLDEAMMYCGRGLTGRNVISESLECFHQPSALSIPIRDEMEQIQRCFSDKSSVEEIFAAVESESGPWAERTLKALRKASPVSLKVTFEMVRRGADMSLGECLKMEYRIANHFMKNPDFVEGVRALLIDRDNKPQWSAASLSEVTPQMVQHFFEPLSAEEYSEPELPIDEFYRVKMGRQVN